MEMISHDYVAGILSLLMNMLVEGPSRNKDSGIWSQSHEIRWQSLMRGPAGVGKESLYTSIWFSDYVPGGRILSKQAFRDLGRDKTFVYSIEAILKKMTAFKRSEERERIKKTSHSPNVLCVRGTRCKPQMRLFKNSRMKQSILQRDYIQRMCIHEWYFKTNMSLGLFRCVRKSNIWSHAFAIERSKLSSSCAESSWKQASAS